MALSKWMFQPALSTLLLAMVVLASSAAAFADSTVIDAPGVKFEKRQGWFGRREASYHDAMGNAISQKQGLFGRTSTQTRIFGSEATVKNGNNVTVRDANGSELISTRRTLFGGKNTHVDGTKIYQSLKNVLNSTP